MSRGVQRRRRRRRGIHARLGAALRRHAAESALDVFNRIADELDLPADREDWDYEDYEDFLAAIMGEFRQVLTVLGKSQLQGRALRQNLHRVSSALGRAQGAARALRDAVRGRPAAAPRLPSPAPIGRLPSPRRSRSALTPRTTLETTPGTKVVAVPLESGVYLLAEAGEEILDQHGAAQVSRALAEAAGDAISAPPGTRVPNWKELL